MSDIRNRIVNSDESGNDVNFFEAFKYRFYGVLLALFISPVVSALPLSTDDAGTLGKSRSKIELNVESSEEKGSDSKETSVTKEVSIVYGLWDNLNAFVSLPYREISVLKADGSEKSYSGYADTKFGVKWRVFEQGGFSSGLKGTISSPTGDVAKKLGYGQSTYGINAITSYEVEQWETHFNLGYILQPNSLNERDGLAKISAAVFFRPESRWQIMADTGATGSKGLSEALVFFGLGLSYAIAKDMYAEIGWKHGYSANKDEISGLARIAVIF